MLHGLLAGVLVHWKTLVVGTPPPSLDLLESVTYSGINILDTHVYLG